MSERESTGAVVVDPFGGLTLDPSNELRFKGPFDDYVTVSLKIENPTEKRIAFKIKTTAPKRYCVKPNSGVLDPKQSMKVNVLLQPFNYDPTEKNKHKFMVQYLYLNDTEVQMSVNDILNMWKDIPPTRLLDLKLKCIFEFTESEQERLSQLKPVSDSSMPSTRQSSTQKEIAQNQQQSAPQQAQPEKANKTSTSTTQSSSNRPSSLTSRQESSSTDTRLNDFDSVTTNSTNAKSANNNVNNNNNTNVRLEKNDNTINELKLIKQENELLKKEINRLKEEEGRLKKMVLQAGPSNRQASGSLEFTSVADLLNNRLVLIIIVLIAIIFYLLLFR